MTSDCPLADRYKILYLSAHEWSDLWRRRQRLAYELSLRPAVASVLYVSPPVATSVLDLVRGRFEPSHLGDKRRAHLDALLGRPRHVAGRVWAYTGSRKTLPLTRMGAVRRLRLLHALNDAAYVSQMRACLKRLPGERLILYLSHPLHAFALEAFPSRAVSCYDWTDDWTKFELLPVADRAEYATLNERVPGRVDVVFAVSHSLCERAKQLNSRVHWLPNATSLHQSKGHTPEPDPELERIPRPRLGYVGQIGDRIDFALLAKIAQTQPEWSVVMVGPVWDNRLREVEMLGRLPNVHFVGQRSFGALPGVLGQLDVCLIPHTRDALTASMDPIKLYDYLATGKPVVSTRVAGVERFADAVYIAELDDEFIRCIGTALAETGDDLPPRRRAYGRDNSWSVRAEQFWQVLRDVMDEKSSPGKGKG